MGLVPFFILTFAGLWTLLCVVRLTWRRVEYMERHALRTVGEVIAKFRRGFLITVIIFLFLAHMPLTEEIFKLITVCNTLTALCYPCTSPLRTRPARPL
jgi:hypothetical protein